MFRKRQRFQANPLPADQLAVLIKANQLMSEGKASEAGPLFTDMAATMQRSNHPRRAANLYARAAHAFSDASNEQAALNNAKMALALFTQFKMSRRAPIFYINITNKMSARGMKGAVMALQQEFGAQIGSLPVESRQENRQQRGLLPTNCPKCGAMVHGDEVDWVDESTAECEYCGTLIRIEQ